MRIVTCSPKKDGSTDTLARLVAEGAHCNDTVPEIVPLRDFQIRPCVACGFCTSHPDFCPLDAGDDVADLLHTIRAEVFPVFVLPVYFYGPPAQFKAFIDRAQRFWALPVPQTLRPASAIICAARFQGERLFEANLLILRCFLRALGFSLKAPLLLRGIESPADLTPEHRKTVQQWGSEWAKNWLSLRLDTNHTGENYHD